MSDSLRLEGAGLLFVTISEKITPSYLANYSIIGFYTIIVYAIGTLLRRGKDVALI